MSVQIFLCCCVFVSGCVPHCSGVPGFRPCRPAAFAFVAFFFFSPLCCAFVCVILLSCFAPLLFALGVVPWLFAVACCVGSPARASLLRASVSFRVPCSRRQVPLSFACGWSPIPGVSSLSCIPFVARILLSARWCFASVIFLLAGSFPLRSRLGRVCCRSPFLLRRVARGNCVSVFMPKCFRFLPSKPSKEY